MKKFFKIFFSTLFIAIIVLCVVFNKKIMLGYGIAEKYLSLKNTVPETKDINLGTSLTSMNYSDVVYKNTNGVPLTLDIYAPTKQIYKSSPVLLYVHGGSFAYGDKSIPSALNPALDTFRGQGYTIISTSYELMRNKENFHKQISDVKDTLRWIHKNESVYNLDSNEIGVIGFSSGAYLSLMAGYTTDSEFVDDGELKNYSSKIKYLIDFAGPTDLGLLNTRGLNSDLTKILLSITNKEDLIKQYNPINYVSTSTPSTLIIHSNSDTTVPYESSKELYDKCMEVNSKAQIITLNSSAHDLSSISNEDIVSISEGLLKFVLLNSPL